MTHPSCLTQKIIFMPPQLRGATSPQPRITLGFVITTTLILQAVMTMKLKYLKIIKACIMQMINLTITAHHQSTANQTLSRNSGNRLRQRRKANSPLTQTRDTGSICNNEDSDDTDSYTSASEHPITYVSSIIGNTEQEEEDTSVKVNLAKLMQEDILGKSYLISSGTADMMAQRLMR